MSGDYAYLAGGLTFGDDTGLQVLDVRDRSNPQWVGELNTAGWAYGVAVSGNRAFVADGDAGLQVIDVSDPFHPQWVAGHDTSGTAYAVTVSGLYVYVADGDGGLVILRIEDCSVPDEWDVRGDFSGDGVLNLPDLPMWIGCMTDPCGPFPCEPPLYLSACCAWVDSPSDGDVDLQDFAVFQRACGGGP